MRLVFTGHIAGTGTGSGLRIVIGAWDRSPFGAFTDVMLQTAGDERVLLAPDDAVAEFVAPPSPQIVAVTTTIDEARQAIR